MAVQPAVRYIETLCFVLLSCRVYANGPVLRALPRFAQHVTSRELSGPRGNEVLVSALRTARSVRKRDPLSERVRVWGKHGLWDGRGTRWLLGERVPDFRYHLETNNPLCKLR